MDWCRGQSPGRRSGSLYRHLLLEQRLPRAHAVQAAQWQLDAAGLGLRNPPPSRHPLEPDRHRLHPLVLRERCCGSNGHRHQLDRGCPGHHGLRHSDRWQLVRRRCHLFGRRHLFDRGHRLGSLGDGRPREQRRGQSECQRQRHIHLRLPRGPERLLRRHRAERSFGSGLHGRQRIRDRGFGQRHQHLRHLCRCGDRWHLFDRGHRLGALGDGRPREQRRGQSECQRQRHIHLRLPRGPERLLRRHRAERSFGSGLHGRQRIRDRGFGQRHQRLRHLCRRVGRRPRLR